MLKRYTYIFFAILLITNQLHAQTRPGSGMDKKKNSGVESSSNPENSKKNKAPAKPKIPSHIKTWEISEIGSVIKKTELDTTLNFYHVYHPFYQNSISNTFTGNNGGAYLSNDFFKRNYSTDFYFIRSFDAYWLTPYIIRYYNTTTPYSLLDYSQSESRVTKNETRFNVFLSQNINKKFNYEFIYNQTKSQGQYLNQETKFHNLALATSYISNKFLSHSNIIFNRLLGQENGGIDHAIPFNDATETDQFTTQITDDAFNKLQNNNIFTVNEYRVGKTIAADTIKRIKEKFIPRVGFIYQAEFSNNKRRFTKTDPTTFFKNIYDNDTLTHDSTKYSRVTNIFQIKFYEAPDRKYTFGKLAYIGNDQLWYSFSKATGYYPTSQSNTFIGGGIFRNDGKFWQWEANGRIYLTGYRAGQTELKGVLNKPLKIGIDTTNFRIEGSLKTTVPDYYDQYFYSNHFQWKNNFDNINEMTIRSSISSQELKATIGANYSLIGNFIYNNENALPTQSNELLILSAYLKKDFERDHWVVRIQALAQKASNGNLIHLPAFAGFISLNYRTVISKVMHFQIGADTRYNTAFYADAYEPATARFYWQNKTLIGNYPYVDLHLNLKLKRTRFFFTLMNAASGIAGNNYFMAPDYPYMRRTYRIGLAWSFYD